MPDYTVNLYKRKKRKHRKSRSRQALHRELVILFNAKIRKRDGRCMMGEMFPGCSGYLTAGHVVPKEDSCNVEFIEDNVFGQCSGHNYNHRYHRSKYNTWFIKTHGAKRFQEISEIATMPKKVLNSQQLQVLIEKYK